jgi:hypothetical protein
LLIDTALWGCNLAANCSAIYRDKLFAVCDDQLRDVKLAEARGPLPSANLVYTSLRAPVLVLVIASNTLFTAVCCAAIPLYSWVQFCVVTRQTETTVVFLVDAARARPHKPTKVLYSYYYQ